MAGIYVHVPFCKVKCHYCDFHFSIQLKNRKELVAAICQEITLRNTFLEEDEVKTIYFGGGTPSLLEVDLIADILNKIYSTFSVNPNCEITLECNPDDLDLTKLKALRALGVNRLSIGIQSFNDATLTFMNRAHKSMQATASVELARQCGFDNLTIDLIYGVPGSSMETWKSELNKMAELEIPHLSAYCLTIEENTVFGNWQKNGKLKPFSDIESLNQFNYLIEFAQKHQLEQYEISNFSKEGFISKHNSAYWLGEKYMGIGPSAHSYNGIERGWNIANNPQYMNLIKNEKPFYESEQLSVNDRFNEYILTRLRTKWGIDLEDLKQISPEMTASAIPIIEKYMDTKEVQKQKNIYTLTRTGKFIADGISADLFQ